MTSSAWSDFTGDSCEAACFGGTALGDFDVADLPAARLVDARLARVADDVAASSSSSFDTSSPSPFTVDGAFSKSYGSSATGGALNVRRVERFAEEVDCWIEEGGGCAAVVVEPGTTPDGPSELRRRLLADVLGSVRFTGGGAGSGAFGVGSGDGSAGGSEDSPVVVDSGSGSGSGAAVAKAKRSPKSASSTWWRLQRERLGTVAL